MFNRTDSTCFSLRDCLLSFHLRFRFAVSNSQFIQMSVEDFIRNFLVAHDMKRSLDAFQTEWFQLQRNASSLKTALPRIFQQYEELQKEMSVLKQAAATSAAVATEAKSTTI